MHTPEAHQHRNTVVTSQAHEARKKQARTTHTAHSCCTAPAVRAAALLVIGTEAAREPKYSGLLINSIWTPCSISCVATRTTRSHAHKRAIHVLHANAPPLSPVTVPPQRRAVRPPPHYSLGSLSPLLLLFPLPPPHPSFFPSLPSTDHHVAKEGAVEAARVDERDCRVSRRRHHGDAGCTSEEYAGPLCTQGHLGALQEQRWARQVVLWHIL